MGENSKRIRSKPIKKEIKQKYVDLLKMVSFRSLGNSSSLRYISVYYVVTDGVINIFGDSFNLLNAIYQPYLQRIFGGIKVHEEDNDIGEKTKQVAEVPHVKIWGGKKNAGYVTRCSSKKYVCNRDQCPHLAAQTGFTVLLSRWAEDAGLDVRLKRIKKVKLCSKPYEFVDKWIAGTHASDPNALLLSLKQIF